jgi:hypothetical protein
MNLLLIEWNFRTLWACWPLQTKFYFLCLIGATIYSLISLSRVFLALKELARITPAADTEAFYRKLSARLHNSRQLHLLFLLLFGLFLTDEAFRTAQSLRYLDRGFAAPTTAALLDPLLGFAFLSLLVLTILHSLQWLVSSCLEATMKRPKKPT